MRVETTVKHDLWQLQADTDNPLDPSDLPAQCLVGQINAAWSTAVLPPVTVPSTCSFSIYQSTEDFDVLGWIPLELGDPIGVYVITDGYSGPITFQGRIADVSAVNWPGGGMVFTVICTDWHTDLYSQNAPPSVGGRRQLTTGIPPISLFAAYADLAATASAPLDFDWTTGGFPYWTSGRKVDLTGVSLGDALSRFVITHINDDDTSHFLTYHIDFADPSPLSPPIEYKLSSYAPDGADNLAGLLQLVNASGTYVLEPNPDYYDDHTGIVIDAAQLAFDVGEWRKQRQAAINTLDVNGLFYNPEKYPSTLGTFWGSTAATTTATPQPNIQALPAGINSGDWGWCLITAATAVISEPIVPPAGWTQIPTGPMQSASTVRAWLFIAELSEADSGTTPVWTLQTSEQWALVGGVITDTDGLAPYSSPGSPGSTNDAISSTTVTYPSVRPPVDHCLAVSTVGARWGTGTAATFNDVAGWLQVANFQSGNASDKMGAVAITKRLANMDLTGPGTGTVTSAANNGCGFTMCFIPASTTQRVRKSFATLAARVGPNTRSVESSMYYRDDAEHLAEVLLGDESQVQQNFGITQATIAWETLTDDQRAAWSLEIWPTGTSDNDPQGRPVGFVNIPLGWRLVDGPVVFGRLMGLNVNVAGDKVRADLTLRAVPALTTEGITYNGLNAFTFPSVRYNNIDPAITIEQMSLLED